MARPNAKMKVSKDGSFRFESKVDQAEYFMKELIHSANLDVARLIRKRVGIKLVSYYDALYVKGSKKGEAVVEPRKAKLISKYPMQALRHWARKKDLDLLIGFKQESWYGKTQELGDNGVPRLNILKSTVMESIPDIRKVQSQYLSALNNTNPSVIEKGDEND